MNGPTVFCILKVVCADRPVEFGISRYCSVNPVLVVAKKDMAFGIPPFLFVLLADSVVVHEWFIEDSPCVVSHHDVMTVPSAFHFFFASVVGR